MKKVQQPPDYDPESAIRVLNDPEVRKLADEYNEKYYHWEEVRYRVTDDFDPRIVWNLMRFMRNVSAFKLNLLGIEYSYNITAGIIDNLHFIDKDAAGHLEARMPGKTDAKKFLVSSLMEEAIASSQMEGASTTRKVAKSMLRSRRAPRDMSERMILNNYLAMEGVKEMAESELTPEMIKEMHRTIAKDTLRDGSDWEGRFRESDDIVVGSPLEADLVYHVPPSHVDVPRMIDDLCKFANERDTRIHPLIKAIILHYMIGYIHPFVDGNGRVARSLFYWFSLREGYWLLEYASISSILKTSKGKYGQAYQFTETDDNDLTYFIRFNLECLRKSIDSLTSYLDRKYEEQKAATKMIESDPDLNIVEATILKKQLKERTVISIYDVQTEYHLSYQSARKYVLHLVDEGYLSIVGKVGKRVLYSLNEETVKKIENY